MDSRRIWLIGLLLLLGPLSGRVSAQGLLGANQSCFGATLSAITDYDQPLAMSFILVALLISVAYMVSQAIENPQLSVWAKTEAVTYVWSAVLVVGVLAAFSASCEFTNFFAGLPPGSNPSLVAGAYLDNLANVFGLSIVTDIVQSSIADQFNSMPFAYWGFPWSPSGGGGTAYLASQRAWSAHKEIIAGLYVPFLASIQVQRLALDALVMGVLSLLLPGALVLRMFFVTRDVGNFLIALAFSIYIFVPMTYVMAQSATQNVISAMHGTPLNPLADMTSVTDPIVGDSLQKLGFLATQAVLIPNIILVVLVTSTMAINKGLKGLVG